MTTRINLLPHREERRKRARQHFMATAVLTVIAGLVIVGAVHLYFAERISVQDGRNKFLKDEIAKLDKQIAEIKKLQEQTAALLARKKVVETLQSNRAEVVHLLDQLVRQLPDGMYLKEIKQKGDVVTISGYTQSQARVSTLMRNLESSNTLENPGLIEIKAVQLDGQRINQFTMNIKIVRAKTEEETSSKTRGRPAKG
jgi:type IV pilus assembly protein PilN